MKPIDIAILLVVAALAFFAGYQTGASETPAKLVPVLKQQILDMSHMMRDEQDTKYTRRAKK